MHKQWSIEDIQLVINEISEKWNLPCNIRVEVSKRAKKRMGAFFYRKSKGKIEPLKFVFAQCLLDGSYSEKIVREVIIHEYLHYYCNITTNTNNGHNNFFKTCCIKSNISSSSTFKHYNEQKSTGKKEYNIYCSKCNKLVCTHVRKDAAIRKVDKYISKCCREKLYCKDLFL